MCLSVSGMGAPSSLAKKMDFSIGKQFELDVRRRFGVQVHHESPSPRGSFLLLATFHRFLFRLTEESVALALQSCLGDHAPFFHVIEVSHNHFLFSVSCKSVGFLVYALRRVIGSSFDIYFHLWSNGAPHWECEKRMWEAEEARKWTEIQSKSQKRVSKAWVFLSKKVSFNPKLILPSPAKKAVLNDPKAHTICFGSISTTINPQSHLEDSFVVGSISSKFADHLENLVSLANAVHLAHSVSSGRKPALKKSASSDILNLGSGFMISNQEHIVIPSNRELRSFNHVQCSRCMRWGHSLKHCRFPMCCLVCFNYGHGAKQCLLQFRLGTRWVPKRQPGPRLEWKPKLPLD